MVVTIPSKYGFLVAGNTSWSPKKWPLFHQSKHFMANTAGSLSLRLRQVYGCSGHRRSRRLAQLLLLEHKWLATLLRNGDCCPFNCFQFCDKYHWIPPFQSRSVPLFDDRYSDGNPIKRQELYCSPVLPSGRIHSKFDNIRSLRRLTSSGNVTKRSKPAPAPFWTHYLRQ